MTFRLSWLLLVMKDAEAHWAVQPHHIMEQELQDLCPEPLVEGQERTLGKLFQLVWWQEIKFSKYL